jgi:ComF family protein
MMADRIASDARYKMAEIVLAVPLHGARKRERGYNQAQLLAVQLGKNLGIPSPEGIVERSKQTKSQTTMNKEQRRRNVEGIFAVREPEKIKGKTVILVDDVLTTGATIGSCGHTLLAAGARKVLAATAAAAPL